MQKTGRTEPFTGARPPGEMRERVALALIGGGAVGNLADRIRLGEVIDFLDVGLGERPRWPTFNVADMSIVIGTIIILVIALAYEIRKKKNKTIPPPTAP